MESSMSSMFTESQHPVEKRKYDSFELGYPPKSSNLLVVLLVVTIIGLIGFSLYMFSPRPPLAAISFPTPPLIAHPTPAVFLASPTATPAIVDIQGVYRNTDFNFEVHYPESWSFCRSSYFAIDPKEAVCTIEGTDAAIMFDVIPSASLKQYLDIPGAKIILKNTKLSNGAVKYMFDLTNSGTQGTQKFIEIITPINQNQGLFVIKVQDLGQELVADQILSTFKFTNGNSNSEVVASPQTSSQ
jgi:hypothetical protein